MEIGSGRVGGVELEEFRETGGLDEFDDEGYFEAGGVRSIWEEALLKCGVW